MAAPYESAITGAFSLISEWIDDDDLKAKLLFEEKKLKFELDKVLLNTNTTPKTDAFVKIMIATRDIIIPMMRPVGSLMLAGFGAYCLANNIVLPETIQVLLFGAPLGYGASRHAAKKEKEKTRRMKIREKKENDDFFDDDDYE